ncbi:oxidoreductase [Henriciella sp. AS95]|uniref:oxidoreductase n=1 Tax=Henriciella sp. AS95 TaxID=3135782 RepID=UPI0031757D70
MAAKDQLPVGSGFHAKSTAKEVLEGIDLSGMNAIVTGGYSGIGLEMVRALSEAGAHVTVPARRLDVARAALADLSEEIAIAEIDLADIASVRAFAGDYVASERPLHILINNAGVMASPLNRVGPGWESQFGINHLGHMALTLALEPAIDKANQTRVVSLSSSAHIRSDVIWDDPNYETRDYDKWEAYGQAKSADALFANALDRKWKHKDVTAFSVHPGGIFTPLQRHLPEEELVALGWKNADGTIPEAVKAMFKTPEQGASTAVWAATSPKLEGRGGEYCEDCDIATLADENSPRWQHARVWITDETKADRLWQMSEGMLARV